VRDKTPDSFRRNTANGPDGTTAGGRDDGTEPVQAETLRSRFRRCWKNGASNKVIRRFREPDALRTVYRPPHHKWRGPAASHGARSNPSFAQMHAVGRGGDSDIDAVIYDDERRMFAGQPQRGSNESRKRHGIEITLTNLYDVDTTVNCAFDLTQEQ
jgi:hypothetical protein